MTLREFVSVTLGQVVAGIQHARAANEMVAPSVAVTSGRSGYSVWHQPSHSPALLVDFDVAVTVSIKSETEAGSGVSIYVFEAGAQHKGAAEHSTLSHIKFQVPVTYDKP